MKKDKITILQERARLLAQPRVSAQASDEVVEIIPFRLVREQYAIERKYVEEVQPLREFTPLSCTPAFLPGMINVRGKVLAVIDIKKFFGLPDEGITDLHTVLIVRAGEVEAGILADLVDGVRSVPCRALQEPLPTHTGIRADYLLGITADRVAVLNVLSILTDPDVQVNETVNGDAHRSRGK